MKDLHVCYKTAVFLPKVLRLGTNVFSENGFKRLDIGEQMFQKVPNGGPQMLEDFKENWSRKDPGNSAGRTYMKVG